MSDEFKPGQELTFNDLMKMRGNPPKVKAKTPKAKAKAEEPTNE